ncbi:MAG: TIM barrel protein [Candidatus Hodarchaeales archaeon]|jgi:sugar phosphate isomerase/epimerase
MSFLEMLLINYIAVINISFKTGLTIQKTGSINPSDWLMIASAIELEHVEFDMTVFSDIDNVLAVNKIDQIAIHAPYFDDYNMDFSSDRSEIEQFVKNVNDYREALKIKYVVIHPPNDPQGSTDTFFTNIDAVEPFILLENMPCQAWNDFIQLFTSIRERVSNKTGFCFDVPHGFITHGEESFLELPTELLELVRSPDGYIHLSGGLRNEDTHLPLVTDGDIPFEKVEAFLKEFSGTLTMELQPRGINDIDKIIKSYKIMLGISGKRWLSLKTAVKERVILKKVNQLAEKHGITRLEKET